MMNSNIKVYEYAYAYEIAIDYLHKKGYERSDGIEFTYKYNYVYKHLQDVNCLNGNFINDDYKHLYEGFCSEVKNKHSIFISNGRLTRGVMRSYIIVRAYKINKLLGNLIKLFFINARKIVKGKL